MTNSIKLIVGLANPGPQYQATRHNAGAWFIEELLKQYHGTLQPDKKFKGETCKLIIQGHEYHILIPTTFMNLSGEAIAAMANFYKIPVSAILVAHDELDLPAGIVRFKAGGGHGGHNGLRSTIQCLGSNDFNRVRIGIGHPGSSHLVTDYVLHKPSKADQQKILLAIDDALQALPSLLAGDIQKAMHQLHTQ